MSAESDEHAIRRARSDVHRAAMYLAEMGLSVEKIRTSMQDVTATATASAVAYAIRHDNDEEERRCAIDREDPADASDMELDELEHVA